MATPIESLTKIMNPFAIRLARTGRLSVWGVVYHTGRKSGRAFSTPIALAATPDQFFVPLPWGTGTDWCRNLMAAQGGAIRYRGRDYLVSDPQVVDADVARPAFPGPIRLILPFVGIKRFLRLRRGELAQHAA